MSIFKLLAVTLISVVLTVVVKTYRPEMAVQTSIAAGATVILMLVGQITGVLNMITDAVRSYGLNEEYFTVALKTAGIAYLAQLASQTCMDAGESALAAKVELGGRIMILALAAPVAFKILDLAIEAFQIR